MSVAYRSIIVSSDFNTACFECNSPLNDCSKVVAHESNQGLIHSIHEVCVKKHLLSTECCPQCHLLIDTRSLLTLKERSIHAIYFIYKDAKDGAKTGISLLKIYGLAITTITYIEGVQWAMGNVLPNASKEFRAIVSLVSIATPLGLDIYLQNLNYLSRLDRMIKVQIREMNASAKLGMAICCSILPISYSSNFISFSGISKLAIQTISLATVGSAIGGYLGRLIQGPPKILEKITPYIPIL